MQGIFAPAGAGAGSFSILIAIVMARLSADQRSMAGGIVNAGGSIGQFIFAPLVQFMIHLRGHYASFIMLAALALLSIIPAWILCRLKISAPPPPAPSTTLPETATLVKESLKEQLAVALRNPSYLLLSAGFFTCGFHVAFLITHLPGEVSLCGHSAAVSAASISLIGLCNIAGSLGAGFLGKYLRMKYILAFTYASRALIIFIYLMSDKSEAAFYAFAIAIGFTWLATVSPTAGIISKIFGMRYFATLFGIAFLVHQLGGFLGAWLGGIAMQYDGSYLWVWYMDIALALLAALANLPIKEGPAPPLIKRQ
jgi:predicted MFS family arabinose efflux permease